MDDFDFPGRDRLEAWEALRRSTRRSEQLDELFDRLLSREVVTSHVLAEDGRRVDHLDVVRAVAAKHLSGATSATSGGGR